MTRILKKSKDRVLAGVLGGIAEYLGWDYTMTRIAFVLLSIMSVGFPGFIIYAVLWFVMPD